MTPFDSFFASEQGQAMARSPHDAHMVDGFGRNISYLRLSVTDRCDMRCVYCMAEDMQFLPKRDVLSLEELDRLASLFIRMGVKRLRLTGGEPLVRKGVLGLFQSLSRHLQSGQLQDLTLTTNGAQLARFAEPLARLGVRRVNVSLDSLDPERFARITRGAKLGDVLEGLAAAREAGLKVKINTVALAQDNFEVLPDMVRWAHDQGFDLTLIEAMPMGEIDEDRSDQFVDLTKVRQSLAAVWTLNPLVETTGGPARYWRVAETGGKLGFITPLSHTFCEACNRIRVTCTGTLHTCLGQEDAVDLRAPLRASADDAPVAEAIRGALALKPKGHDFQISRRPSVARHMSTTGG